MKDRLGKEGVVAHRFLNDPSVGFVFQHSVSFTRNPAESVSGSQLLEIGWGSADVGLAAKFLTVETKRFFGVGFGEIGPASRTTRDDSAGNGEERLKSEAGVEREQFGGFGNEEDGFRGSVDRFPYPGGGKPVVAMFRRRVDVADKQNRQMLAIVDERLSDCMELCRIQLRSVYA